MQQNEALNLLKMGRNVFLTGAAGSGKTYLLNQYINYLKSNNVRVAITASTGIAATHIHGTTIHSWSGIGVRDSITSHDLDKLLTAKRIKSNYKKTKVLIIDEISMLASHHLDMIDTIARYMLSNEKAFGGMQVILCGDFFQLPPVNSGPSVEEKRFAFEASSWAAGDFHVCYLHEQHRQGNDPLLTVLNDIRSGTAGEHTKVPLRTRYKKEPEGATKATKLYSRNINVDAINERELANIASPERAYTMKSNGFSALVEGLKKNCLAPEQLRLKLGAEVMFIKNDNMNRYANGTRGVVEGFESDTGWPVVKMYNNRIINVEPEDWNYEDNGIIRATLTQIPLRLAWAITIHKSQGMTLDAAEMDLGDAFEPGMGYVALSRVRALTGLKLMNLNEMALTVHPKVLQQDYLFKDESEKAVQFLSSLSEQELEQQQRATLIQRFVGIKVNASSQAKAEKEPGQTKVKKEVIPTHLTTLALLKEDLSIDAVAAIRELTPGTIVNHIDKLNGLKLLDAAFLEQLKNTIPKEDFDILYAAFEQSEEGKLTPIYEQFEGRYSYTTVRLVRLFMGE
jgi:hypothetical protein